MNQLAPMPLPNQPVLQNTLLADVGPEHFQTLNSYEMIYTALYTLCPHGRVEIRCLGVGGRNGRTDSGYFDDFHKAAAAVVQQYVNDGLTRGVYFVLNPFGPELIASNRFEQSARTATRDTDISCRKWLFIDCDSVRLSGINATDDQVNQARERAIRIARWLISRGFRRPILVMSGNGAHLHFPISLPNDPHSHALVSNVLRTLDVFFSDDIVHIDRTVSNAARICRLPGTIARKGDATSDRPHRMARLEVVPGYLADRSGAYCDPEALRAVAAMSEPTNTVRSLTASTGSSSRLMVPEYLRNAGIEFVEKANKDGEFTRYRLKECPFNRDHKSPDAMVFQLQNGATGFKCLHNSCADHHWLEFTQKVGKPKPEHYDSPRNTTDLANGGNATLRSKSRSVWDAIKSPPRPREVVIDGLARRGDVVNVISSTKFGKSWFAAMMAYCVATGRPWLNRSVMKGNVLLIDNELYDEDIQIRLKTMADAMLLLPNDQQYSNFDYIPLRGELLDIKNLQTMLYEYQPRELTLIVLDAKYRFFGELDENDNKDQAIFHNIVDQLAKHLQCVIVMIHHSSKGEQGGKSVTDVGSGGGAQSRAADCHLVIRPHPDAGLAVLDAAVRTFKPVESQTIRWGYPLWTVVAPCDGVSR